MKRVWGVVILLITYGSLYPFNFYFISQHPDLISSFLATWNDPIFEGDLLANVVIFIPFGFIGWFVTRQSIGMRLLMLSSIGFLFAMALQVLQFYLPSRTPSIVDGLSNMAGILLGAFGAWVSWFWHSKKNYVVKSRLIAPVTLMLFWFGLRLLPFIPFFRWKQIEISLRPLYQNPQVHLIQLLGDVAAWTTVFLFLREVVGSLKLKILAAIVLTCFTLETLIIYNHVSLNNVLGAGIAIGLWSLLRQFDRPEKFLLLLTLGYIVLNGLSPFQLAQSPQEFHWVPFTGFLGGSIFFNTLTFFSKFFFYGAAVWLMANTGRRWLHATLMVAGITLAIETIQIFTDSHTPEITDPLLVIIIGWLLHTARTGSSRLPVAQPV